MFWGRVGRRCLQHTFRVLLCVFVSSHRSIFKHDALSLYRHLRDDDFDEPSVFSAPDGLMLLTVHVVNGTIAFRDRRARCHAPTHTATATTMLTRLVVRALLWRALVYSFVSLLK
jgi:hypothetical protein